VLHTFFNKRVDNRFFFLNVVDKSSHVVTNSDLATISQSDVESESFGCSNNQAENECNVIASNVNAYIVNWHALKIILVRGY
jgi:hypothetical protein